MEEVIKVQFYKHKQNKDVYAVFPETWNGETFTCYAHVGQHGNVVKGYIDESIPAKVEEYKNLLNELTMLVGYQVLVVPAKRLYTKEELLNYIGIGFCQPKFYKRSAWLKAKEIMDFLVSIEGSGVFEHDFGHGKGKYNTNKGINNNELADLYLKSY